MILTSLMLKIFFSSVLSFTFSVKMILLLRPLSFVLGSVSTEYMGMVSS